MTKQPYVRPISLAETNTRNIASNLYNLTNFVNANINALNVKNFGATGDGTTDDTAAIQATLNAAFGSPSNPNGLNNKANMPVFFPAGNYKITSPLYLIFVVGGLIFGAGSACTRIFLTGAFSGNTVVANGITPVFMTNGYKWSQMRGLNLSCGTSGVGFYLYQDGTQGDSTGNTFSDMVLDTGQDGFLAGYQSIGECSECVYINCTFIQCSNSGLATVSFNALNHSVYGGGGFNNGTLYKCVTGSISPICDVSAAGNTMDIVNQSTNPVSIIGGRTECANSISTGSAQFHISGFQYQPGAGGIMVDASAGGSVVMDSCNFSSGDGAGTIVKLGTAGRAILDNFISAGATAVISGSGSSKLYLRGCSFANANVIAAYTGTVAQNI